MNKSGRKPEKSMTEDQVKQILKLAKDTDYSDIAKIAGVTKFQINRVLMETKKQLRDGVSDDSKRAKVEEYIKRFLTPPQAQDIVPNKSTIRPLLDRVIDDMFNNMDNKLDKTPTEKTIKVEICCGHLLEMIATKNSQIILKYHESYSPTNYSIDIDEKTLLFCPFCGQEQPVVINYL